MPLGVGAVLVTSDDFVILGRRSALVGELKGYVDLPGGHPEPSAVNIERIFSVRKDRAKEGRRQEESETQSNEHYDCGNKKKKREPRDRENEELGADDIAAKRELFKSITAEIEEEFGVRKSEMRNPLLIGLASNAFSQGRVTVEFAVGCGLSLSELRDRYEREPPEEGEEMSEVFGIRKEDVIDFCQSILPSNGKNGNGIKEEERDILLRVGEQWKGTGPRYVGENHTSEMGIRTEGGHRKGKEERNGGAKGMEVGIKEGGESVGIKASELTPNALVGLFLWSNILKGTDGAGW